MLLMEKLAQLRSFIVYWYIQWEINTAVYMMEPLEKACIHGVLFAIIGVLVLAAVTYLPGHMIMMLHFFEGVHDTQH